MGKRSNFERRERDFYPTPYEAVVPLLDHIQGVKEFVEPCAGSGDLVRHLEQHGKVCVHATDIEPHDCLDEVADTINEWAWGAPYRTVITNPPWDRELLHMAISKWVVLFPEVWLLFDADWAHTKQASSFIYEFCTDIVSVGRVKWIPGSKHTGKDNVCWYRFVYAKPGQYARFHRRK